MFLLVAGMQLSIIRFLFSEHLENDFQQSLSQAPESAGMAHALVALFLIISLPPSAGFAEAIRPQMNGVAEKFVAGPADFDFGHLAGLVTNWGGAGKALQHVVVPIPLQIGADRRQEARC